MKLDVLRAPTSSWRPFEPLDFAIRVYRCVCDAHTHVCVLEQCGSRRRVDVGIFLESVRDRESMAFCGLTEKWPNEKSWSRFLWNRESQMKMNRGWRNKLRRNWVEGNQLRKFRNKLRKLINKLRKLRNKLSRNWVEGKAGRKVENVTNPSSSSGQCPDTQTLFLMLQFWICSHND